MEFELNMMNFVFKMKQGGVWMYPNADFVPIYSDKKCLTLKTYLLRPT